MYNPALRLYTVCFPNIVERFANTPLEYNHPRNVYKIRITGLECESLCI